MRELQQAQATAVVTADAGYWDTTSLSDPFLDGIQVLVSPDSKPHNRLVRPCP